LIAEFDFSNCSVESVRWKNKFIVGPSDKILIDDRTPNFKESTQQVQSASESVKNENTSQKKKKELNEFQSI
jgi:hypothetical protein